MAFDSVASTNNRTNTWEANLLHVSKFEQIMLNLSHMSYFKKRLLAYFPGNELPVYFFDFMVDIKEARPSKKFINDARKSTNEDVTIQLAYFGSRIWSRANEVRLTINGSMNPLWVQLTKSKSGCGSNINAVIEGIRKCTWPIEAISRAVTNTRTQISRSKKETKKHTSVDPNLSYINNHSDEEDDEVPEEDNTKFLKEKQGPRAIKTEDSGSEFNKLYVSNFKKVFVKVKPSTYYPTYWLTFLLIGRPAGKDGRPPLEAGIYFIYQCIT